MRERATPLKMKDFAVTFTLTVMRVPTTSRKMKGPLVCYMLPPVQCEGTGVN